MFANVTEPKKLQELMDNMREKQQYTIELFSLGFEYMIVQKQKKKPAYADGLLSKLDLDLEMIFAIDHKMLLP